MKLLPSLLLGSQKAMAEEFLSHSGQWTRYGEVINCRLQLNTYVLYQWVVVNQFNFVLFNTDLGDMKGCMARKTLIQLVLAMQDWEVEDSVLEIYACLAELQGSAYSLEKDR